MFELEPVKLVATSEASHREASPVIAEVKVVPDSSRSATLGLRLGWTKRVELHLLVAAS